MPTHHTLIRAVCAGSHDDPPRLAYADWLDDRGEAARAELIRMMLRHPEWADQPRGPAGRVVTAVLGAFGADWAAAEVARPLALRPGGHSWVALAGGGQGTVEALSFTWRRGFPAAFTMSPADWFLLGPVLLRVAPVEDVHLSPRHLLRIVRLTGRRPVAFLAHRAATGTVIAGTVPLVVEEARLAAELCRPGAWLWRRLREVKAGAPDTADCQRRAGEIWPEVRRVPARQLRDYPCYRVIRALPWPDRGAGPPGPLTLDRTPEP